MKRYKNIWLCRLITLLITWGTFSSVKAQKNNPFIQQEEEIVVLDSQSNISFLGGGANLPQFSMLDINNDSKADLFVFDKHSNKILVYIFLGNNQFLHQPQYETIFPKLSDWALLKDFNKDGKPDLWTRNEDLNSVTLYRNITTPSDNYCKFQLVSEALRGYNFSQLIDTSNIFCDKSNIPAIEDVDNDGDIDFLTLQSTGLGVTLFLNNCVENQLPLDPPSFEMPDDCWGDFSESANTNDIFLLRYPYCRRSYYRYKKHAGGSSLLLLDADGDGDNELLLGNAGYKDLIYLENGKKDFGLKRDSIISYTHDYPFDFPAKSLWFSASYLLHLDPQSTHLVVAPAEADDNSYMTNQKGDLLIYKNKSSSINLDFQRDTISFLNNLFKTEGAYSSPAMADIDLDGYADLLLANNGSKHITKGLADRISYFKGTSQPWHFKLITHDFLSISEDSLQRISICLQDVTGDGKPDLFIGDSFGKVISWENKSKKDSTAFEKANWSSLIDFPFTYASPHIIDVDFDYKNDMLVGSKEGPIVCYKNTGTTQQPIFTHFTDTFGNINNNPLVRRSVYVKETDQWVDSMIKDQEGYTSVTSLYDSSVGNILLLSGKNGTIRFYLPADLKKPLGEYKEDTTYIKSMLPEIQKISIGRMGKICTYKSPDNNEFIVGGSIRGGIDIFKREFASSISSGLLTKSAVSVYPNPFYDLIYFRSEIEIVKINVYDLTGNHILTTSNKIVEGNILKPGLYIAHIYLKDNTIAKQKIIKLQ